jgi:hypothetical protein
VGAVQSALGVTCPLQFAKAGSATTLPQQEKKNGR